MNRDLARIAWYRTHHTFGRRWRGLLGIVLLMGAVGGIPLGSLAGARRTQSSYTTFLNATNPSDLDFSVFTEGHGNSSSDISAKLAAVPGVRHVAAWVDLLAAPLAANGVARLEEVGNVQTMGSTGALSFTQDRLTALQGRRADPAQLDEMMVTPDSARQLHVHVGQVVPIGFFTNAQANDQTHPVGQVKVRPHLQVDMKVVGVVDQNTAVVEDDADRAASVVVFTPALTRKLINGPATRAGADYYGLQLDHGAGDVTRVERSITRLLPAGTNFNFRVTSLAETRVEQALRPDSIALGVFGAVALLAAILLGVQAAAREVRTASADAEVLRAIGAGPVTTATEGLIGVTAAIVGGSLVAVVVAAALSPLFPIGPVRAVYPDRGLSLDATVLGWGFLVLTVAVGAVVGIAALRNAPHLVARRRARVGGEGASLRGLSASGLPVVATSGIGFAIDPGRGRGEAPVAVRSTIVGAALAVALVVATLTFGVSLENLVSHPALYGWNWTYELNPNDGVPPDAISSLRHDRLVSAASGFDSGSVQIDGQTVPALLARTGLGASPPILSGHTLEAKNQVVLGAITLSGLGKRVGDTVSVSYGVPSDGPLYIPPHRLRVVGTATFPAVGGDSFELADHTSMGAGAMFSASFEPARFVKLTRPDAVLGGPGLVFVRLRSGVSPSVGRADLVRISRSGERQLNADPKGGGGLTITVVGVQRPAEIVNYRSMRSLPALLALGLDVAAVAALAVTLTASVRRRRQALAVMKTLGCTGRQVRWMITWQASTIAVLACLVGVPLGIVAGRELWIQFARSISVVPAPSVPVGWIVAIAGVALILANVVAAVPGRMAARTPPASILRGE